MSKLFSRQKLNVVHIMYRFEFKSTNNFRFVQNMFSYFECCDNTEELGLRTISDTSCRACSNWARA